MPIHPSAWKECSAKYAVTISGPILTFGLLGSLAGNVAPVLAYPINACNGFLVTILEWTARTAAATPFVIVSTPGVTPPLVGFFYLGCAPPRLPKPPLSQ